MFLLLKEHAAAEAYIRQHIGMDESLDILPW